MIDRLLSILPISYLHYIVNIAMWAHHRVQIEIRRRSVSDCSPVLGELAVDGKRRLSRCIWSSHPDWEDIEVAKCTIPGMLHKEEEKYYQYIGNFYRGRGEVLELGPWLGRSTFFILQGLRQNPRFSERKLHVFDDFVWRPDWMDSYVPAGDRLPKHADFRPLFERYMKPYIALMDVTKCQIAPYDGNYQVPAFSYSGGAIEMLFVDCGRTIAANEAWYRVLRRHFISGQTLIVMQDWGTHREIPMKWYNQIHLFVAMHAMELEMVHELRHGAVATFVYKGCSEAFP